MGHVKVPLPEELQDLVRDVVNDLETANDGFEADGGGPKVGGVDQRRVSAAPAAGAGTILRLPRRESAPVAVVPRRRGFLVHTSVPVAVRVVGHPIRTRRLAVANRPATQGDDLRVTRVAVPSRILAPEGDPAPHVADVSSTVLTLPARPAELVPVDVAVTPDPWKTLAAQAAPDAVAGAEVEPAPIAKGTAGVDAEPDVEPRTVEPAEVAIDLAPGEPAARSEIGSEPSQSALRSRLGHVLNLGIAALLTFVLVACIGVVGLVVTGHHIEQVVTGSMQPTIPIGSLVVSERIPADQLTVGQILVFPNPNNANEVIVHRIVTLRHDNDGNVLITTKGDYNAAPDNWTVKRPGAAYADAGHWVIPGGGVAADWLRRIGFFGLLGLVVGLIAYQGSKQVRRVLADTPAGGEGTAA